MTPTLATPHVAIRSGTRARTLLACAAFVLAVAAVGWRGLERLNVPGAPDGTHWAFCDFRDAVYYPVVAFVGGVNPYDRRVYRETYPIGTEFPLYAPHTMLVHLPFGLLPFEAAEVAYALFMLALTVALAALALEAAGVPRTAAGVIGLAAVLVLSRPGQNNLLLGQVTGQAVVGSWVALRFAGTRPVLAAVALAVSAFKPTFAIPVALFLLCRGDWRVAIGGGLLATAASLAVVARLIVAAGGVGPFVASLAENLTGFEGAPLVDPTTSPFRVDTAALVGRLLGWTPHAAELPMTLAILVVTGVALARLRGHSDARGAVATTLACAATLACVYHQTYDTLLLVPAAGMLLASRGAVGAVWSPVLLLLLTVPMVNYLATDTGIRELGLAGAVWVVATSLNGLAVTGALCVCLALAWRRVPA